MASWITNPIKDVLSYQLNTGLLPGLPSRQQTSTGIEPPPPKIETPKRFDEESLINGGEFFGLTLLATIAAVWWFSRKRH